jgi:hypothetical protein
MGFTGSLVLARTRTSLTRLEPVAGHDAELVGRREDGWQLAAAHTGYTQDPLAWAAALVDATASPVLIAAVSDSVTARLAADSPEGHRWIAVLNALVEVGPSAAASSDAAAIADVVVAWAAEAGQTVDLEAVVEALSAADRDNRAADQAMTDAADDTARMHEALRNHIAFIEVYVLRLLATLGLAIPTQDTSSWWAHLASQAKDILPIACCRAPPGPPRNGSGGLRPVSKSVTAVR